MNLAATLPPYRGLLAVSYLKEFLGVDVIPELIRTASARPNSSEQAGFPSE
jgi:hypothetical protein